MDVSATVSTTTSVGTAPRAEAERWLERCAASGPMPTEVDVPDAAPETLAALAAVQLAARRTLLILVPDDQSLPAISTALDLALRPLCLVLPSADFAARIALRATLALLRSRLARDDDATQEPAWLAQRQRIASHANLWQDALRWSVGTDRSAWPGDVARLFPVRILPVAAFRELPPQSSDLVVFYRCDLGLQTATLPGQHLHVGQRHHAGLARNLAVNDETLRLNQELVQLTQDVAELELELATAQAELATFTARYFEQVGRRMTELDDLRASLAALRSAQRPDDRDARQQAEALQAEAECSQRDSRRYEDARQRAAPTVERPAFRPAEDVKRLFRQLAQKIHPDRATDEADRVWRTQLMSEANRAYRATDLDALRDVAALWEEGAPPPSAVSTTGPAPLAATPKSVLLLQIERMRRRMDEIQAELSRLFGTKIYELFVAARQALRHGRDLLREMADSLEAQIRGARLELDSAG